MMTIPNSTILSILYEENKALEISHENQKNSRGFLQLLYHKKKTIFSIQLISCKEMLFLTDITYLSFRFAAH